ncbi:hypothetical protein CRV08_06065 [Halarcobacter ebronensis]|uniref:Acylneuraminate cytidylyltransferase n=1 Tax=Halarcobacter ebronensis TaxID=1462615 RepID=A0A4Q0YH19_9BACT|nr:acylneuraminate cytidylyltransferase family protein [Halarcobacter ebronensis]RXJ68994.1 hypothetical protein CRV08_06065 [Halarcobacter ebronensis]
MKILTIIPARCGSKAIKEKNIVDLCGKPLIAYSIEQALALKSSGLVDEVLVSTDCEKIANIAKEYKASVPFLRPENISGDKAKSIEFYLHALEYYENRDIYFDAVLLLQPTSPLRSIELLKNSLDIFIKSNRDSLISVYKEEYINDLVMYKSVSSCELKALNPLHNKGVRRQDHGSTFVRNGAIYITKTQYIKKEHQIISDEPLFIEMSKSDSINIDTQEDLEIIRRILCK